MSQDLETPPKAVFLSPVAGEKERGPAREKVARFVQARPLEASLRASTALPKPRFGAPRPRYFPRRRPATAATRTTTSWLSGIEPKQSFGLNDIIFSSKS